MLHRGKRGKEERGVEEKPESGGELDVHLGNHSPTPPFLSTREPRVPEKQTELGTRARLPALQGGIHVSVRPSWVPGWGNSTCSFLLKIGKFEIQNNDEWKPTRVGVGSTIWVGHRVPSPCVRGTVSRP